MYDKCVVLSNFSICYTLKNVKSYKINKFKISSPTWRFELPDGSCSASRIQDYFNYIIKKYEKGIGNSAIRIFENKKENRIIFRIRIGYYL